ncbi:chorismate mutase [Patescibacteria group bacterium]|nr:chorismate mutase [Patescibacteria group bacterium]MBU1702926.1 chorismate mutase [Patescibacteria group bacterium]MBU1953484.1 chorismate mutase [Patescibacteria group bacterium]
MTKSRKKSEIVFFREKIDKIDSQIIKLLVSRFVFIEKIAQYKKSHDLLLVQKQREKDVLNKLTHNVESKSLRNGFIHAIFRLIFNESKKYQEKIISTTTIFDKKAKN